VHGTLEKHPRERSDPLRGYKVHSKEWKVECFSASCHPILIPAKTVGNQLAFISVHYRSSPQPYHPTSDKAKNVSMGQMSTIASREKKVEKTLWKHCNYGSLNGIAFNPQPTARMSLFWTHVVLSNSTNRMS
jgi:hypothetical protein